MIIALLFACAALRTPPIAPDLTKQPTLYVVGYAHLDTQWRWEYPQTISEFLPQTMHDNFALFEKYPHYIFNFSGANRYRMMQRVLPGRLREAAGMGAQRAAGFRPARRWRRATSTRRRRSRSSGRCSTATRIFRRELGRTSAEYMLPDCFGFPASLPSILHHMGIRGFSTQKLTWGSSAPVGGPDSPEKTPEGTPFNVGVWEGPDGSSVIAAFNPGSYSARHPLRPFAQRHRRRRSDVDWPKRVQRNGEVSGVFTDYHYYGTGDIGGAPREPSVQLVESIVSKNDGPLHVISSTAEQMFLDIKPTQTRAAAALQGRAGADESLRRLADVARRIRSDGITRTSCSPTPPSAPRSPRSGSADARIRRKRLNDAWTLVMGGQFHDIAAGTATPKAYEYSWNDDVIAMNQFAARADQRDGGGRVERSTRA